MKAPLVLNPDQIGMKDISLVGGKCTSYGEMILNLSSPGVSVPQGFAITTEVYWKFLRANRNSSLVAYFFNERNDSVKNDFDADNAGRERECEATAGAIAAIEK